MKLYLCGVFASIIDEFQGCSGLFDPVQNDLGRYFPGAGGVDAGNVIDGFAMAIVQLETFPVERSLWSKS